MNGTTNARSTSRRFQDRPRPLSWIRAGVLAWTGLFAAPFAHADSSNVTFQTIYEFTGLPSARSPYAAPVSDGNGNFFEPTYYGGTANRGAIVKLDSEGTVTVIYSFPSDGTAPGYPKASLLLGSDGDFYGTTYSGGDNYEGTIYKITPDGDFTELMSFSSSTGYNPDLAQLTEGDDGYLYGTTRYGGSGNNGTVFRIAKDGSDFSVLHAFTAGSDDGGEPRSGLLQYDGDFYGTASTGGDGYGVVYKITASGDFTVLHSFSNGTDGGSPWAPLMLASDGNFYGTTYGGGDGSSGTVYRMAPDGTVTGIHSFSYSSGGYPAAGLVERTEGEMVGAALFGGTNYSGSLFQIDFEGNFETLKSMSYTDPSYIYSTMTPDEDGAFWGGSYSGGSNQYGAIYKMYTAQVPLTNLEASPQTVAFGDTTTLSWNAQNATDCTASATDDSWSGDKDTSGSEAVTPTVAGSVTYTLDCTGEGGESSDGATVTVQNRPTATLSISDSSVALGGDVTLTWSSTDATSCEASGDWSGTLDTDGSQTVTLDSVGTKTFTLTCSNETASASSARSLVVSGPTVDISVTPSEITYGETAKIVWSSTWADSCVASGNWKGDKAVSGKRKVTPQGKRSKTLTYTLTCSSDQGSASASADLTVSP